MMCMGTIGSNFSGRWRRTRALGGLVCAAVAALAPADKPSFDTKTVSFELHYAGEISAYRDVSAFVMPEATLSLDASDSVSGNVLARVVHRNIVREVRRLNAADDSSNRFWFETAFRRWAANVTAELGAARRTQVSLAR